jgi:uncharacterized protein (TIGR00297 family)
MEGLRFASRYDRSVPSQSLAWQSKLILLLVIPCTAVSVVLQGRWYFSAAPGVAIWTLGLSALLGAAALILRAGTPAASATGALLTAGMMFGAVRGPFEPWRSAMVPILAFMVLTSLATRFGGERKQRLGTGESNHGRGAAQVAANLGFATVAMNPAVQAWFIDSRLFALVASAPFSILTPALAALAEAAADTVSSEIGQVLGGRPFMLTTFRRVDPGMDGAVSLAGTVGGIFAATVVAAAGAWALHGNLEMFLLSWAGGVFGLFFDSLLGATLERAGWLNNDAVNFVSTASAAVFSLMLIVILPHQAMTGF